MENTIGDVTLPELPEMSENPEMFKGDGVASFLRWMERNVKWFLPDHLRENTGELLNALELGRRVIRHGERLLSRRIEPPTPGSRTFEDLRELFNAILGEDFWWRLTLQEADNAVDRAVNEAMAAHGRKRSQGGEEQERGYHDVEVGINLDEATVSVPPGQEVAAQASQAIEHAAAGRGRVSGLQPYAGGRPSNACQALWSSYVGFLQAFGSNGEMTTLFRLLENTLGRLWVVWVRTQNSEPEQAHEAPGLSGLIHFLRTASLNHDDIIDLVCLLRNHRRVNLRGANLRGAKLVDLHKAISRHKVISRYAFIKHFDSFLYDLSGANLSGADLSGADLRGTRFRPRFRTRFSGTRLSGADLRNVFLSDADFIGANLRGADLRGADLRGSLLFGTNLRGADLRRADLRHADLRGADLKGAVFSGVQYSSKTRWPSGFDYANSGAIEVE